MQQLRMKDDTLDFSAVAAEIQTFLEPVFDAMVNEEEWQNRWVTQARHVLKEGVYGLNKKDKKQAAMLGVRIGIMFLAASGILILAAYFVLSQNFQNLLTDYTIKLVQATIDQGVATVEYELSVGREEVETMADSFEVPADEKQGITFPAAFSQSDVLRTVYVSEDGSSASDDRKRDLKNRQDIVEAYDGKTAVYGPYFNEENEYVICYSAPVRQNGRVVGALSVEKDGYRFCELIKNIRFANSGESYIINSEGTDIAVSNLDHIEWVNEQYNARRLLKGEGDAATLSVMELEQKGLDGETGVGTYDWADGLCYVAYSPIPSTRWVLLASLHQEEIDAMTQSVLYTSITKGPTLGIGIVVFILLTAIIIFWIVSNMKKSSEINEKLNFIANFDSLTGTLNRNCYHNALGELSNEKHRSLACIYIDVNGLHEINNHLGHQAGDVMLKTLADVLGRIFSKNDIYRIGGDEFVFFCKNQGRQDVTDRLKVVRQELREQGYAISIGVEWRDEDLDVKSMVNMAEDAMRHDKRKYYQENGKERQMRALDQEMERMVLQKQDADAFLSVLAPEFKGVYFVDLGRDTIRHLYIPPYFEEMLKEANDVFSKALHIYNHRIVKPEYRRRMDEFCDYDFVEAQLHGNSMPEFIYQKTDGAWMKLRILKFKTYTPQCRETLWIFSHCSRPFQKAQFCEQ